MKITTENLVTEAEKFRKSKSLGDYLDYFQADRSIIKAKTGCDLDQEITTGDQAKVFAKFCQLFWEALPDRADIRTSAFFTLCDFAEYHCYGGYEDQNEVDEG